MVCRYLNNTHQERRYDRTQYDEGESRGNITVKVSTKALRTVFRILSAQLMEDVTIHPDENGWHIRAIATDMVTLLDAVLGTAAFESYEPWEPFSVDANTFLENLSQTSEWMDVSISGGRLLLRADGLTHRQALYPVTDLCRLPNLQNLTTEVMIPLTTLMGVMVKGDPKHGVAVFECTDDVFRVSCLDTDDLGTILEVPRAECILLEGESKGMFALSALLPFLKALPKGADLDMRTSSDLPMVVTVSDSGAAVMFIVAPYLMGDE